MTHKEISLFKSILRIFAYLVAGLGTVSIHPTIAAAYVAGVSVGLLVTAEILGIIEENV